MGGTSEKKKRGGNILEYSVKKKKKKGEVRGLSVYFKLNAWNVAAECLKGREFALLRGGNLWKERSKREKTEKKGQQVL